MSLSQTPNDNDYIQRIVDTLTSSLLLFPRSVGNDGNATDLISKVHVQEPPTPENVEGTELPYIYVKSSQTPIIRKEPAGRDDRDAKGPELYTLEYYVVCVSKGREFEESQAVLNSIVQAATTTLLKNKRLTDKVGSNPISADAELIVVPFLLDSGAKTLMAKNVVFRPKVFVNLRS